MNFADAHRIKLTNLSKLKSQSVIKVWQMITLDLSLFIKKLFNLMKVIWSKKTF